MPCPRGPRLWSPEPTGGPWGGHTVGVLGHLLSHPSLRAAGKGLTQVWALHTMAPKPRPPHHTGQPWAGLPDQPVPLPAGALGRCRDCHSLSPSYLSVKWADECSWQSCVPWNVTSRVPCLEEAGAHEQGRSGAPSQRLTKFPGKGHRASTLPLWSPAAWGGLCPPSLPPSPDGLRAQPGTRQGLEVRKEVLNNAGRSRGGLGRSLPW